MQDYKYKYEKYKTKYLKIKESLKNNMSGGADDKNNKKNNNTNNKNDPVIKVNCIEVHQKEDDKKFFKGELCKTPPIKIRFHSEEVKLSFIVKSLIRLVNKSLKTKDVKTVEVTEKEKKMKKYDGKDLSEIINLNKNNNYDKIVIRL